MPQNLLYPIKILANDLTPILTTALDSYATECQTFLSRSVLEEALNQDAAKVVVMHVDPAYGYSPDDLKALMTRWQELHFILVGDENIEKEFSLYAQHRDLVFVPLVAGWQANLLNFVTHELSG